MRAALATILLIVLSASEAYGVDLSATSPALKLMGDETPLLKVKAEPQSFVGIPIVITGGTRLDDYYNYGYVHKKETHSSLEFIEAVTPRKLGERCHLYVERNSGKAIVDTITKKSITAAKEGSGRELVRMRAKVALNPANYESGAWDLLELIDAQFAVDGGKDWGPWVIETQRKAEREEAERVAAEKKEAALQATRDRESQREKERAARTRTWTDASRKFSIVAEYAWMVGDKVHLRKRDGTIIHVPVDRLSDADREWLEARRKNPTKKPAK